MDAEGDEIISHMHQHAGVQRPAALAQKTEDYRQ
jgi:hypothetical protein